ncbi:MAG: dienelactone hydrolase family protein [Isosphaeraceae bacterium]
MRATLWAAAGLILAISTQARADEPVPLPGTKPLTLQGDIAAQLVDGADRFLLKKTEQSVAAREAHWKGPNAVEANRKDLARILGVTDPRVPFVAPELVATTERPALVGKAEPFDTPTGKAHGFEVFEVRWPVVGDVFAEGLLLVPTGGEKVADVVAIPDADQTPEQIVGLAPGVSAASQFARKLAQAGCRVIVPGLIDRKVEPRNGRARLTTREFLYRSAFELGRTPTGYEIQTTLAAVDWFVKDAKGADPKVGVIGYGEGGRAAFFAAALDPRIDAVCVSGYVGPREGLWQEPLDRNLFGLLGRFGDAEVAAHLIVPRGLTVEAAPAPDVVIPPNTGGGPGRITTPSFDAVKAEFDRALMLHRLPDTPPDRDHRRLIGQAEGFKGSPFDPITLDGFLRSLGFNEGVPAEEKGLPSPLAPKADPDARRARLAHAIDRHNQELLAGTAAARKAYFAKLDTKTLQTFEQTIGPYRTAFRHDVIGRFDDPFLPANARSRRVYDEPKYTGYEVVLDVWDDLIAYGILLVPKGMKDGEKRPVVVCQHGLEGRPQDVADPKVNNPAYNQYAIRLAERGYVTFAPQNLYIGHDRFRTLQRKANPLGKTLFSLIVPQHQQITDWLKTLPFVDGGKIGFYGLSYGGKSAMRIPPLVSNYCLSICSADFNEWVKKNASTREPLSYVWTPEYEIFEWDLGHTFNYAEMAALIAPRPFMVERGHFDGVGTDEEVGFEFAKVRFLYEAKLGIGDRCEIEWFTGPHTIHGVGTFQFLERHLGRPTP